MDTSHTREIFPIQDLELDLLNPRFLPQPDQPTAIATMLKREWGSVYELAHHIVTHKKLNPLDTTLVVPDHTDPEKKRQVVIEGNRRITALKTLNNPGFLEAAGIIGSQKKKFQDLADLFAKNPIEEIECVVYQDRNNPEVLEWRALKHSGSGNGASPKEWDGMSKERDRAARGKATAQYTLLSKVAASPDATDEVKAAFAEDRFPPSTIKKAIDNPEIRKALGIDKKGEKVWSIVPEPEFIRRLSAFLEDFAQPVGKERAKKTEDDISVAPKQRIYAGELNKRLGLIDEKDKIKPQEVSIQRDDKPKQDTINTETNAILTVRKATAKERKLISKGFSPPNLLPKTRLLVEELRDKLAVGRAPVTIAFAVRGFIEYTLYNTALTFGVDTEPDGLKDLGLRVAAFFQKENEAIRKYNNDNKLKGNKRKPDRYLKTIVASLQDLCNGNIDTNPYSIPKLHNYVHNPYMIPDEEGLHKLWDTYEPILKYLWDQVDKATSNNLEDGTTQA